MTDWSNPALTSTYSDVLTYLKGRDESLAKMDFSSDSNFPTNSIRYSAANDRFEIWNGSTWDALDLVYANVAENETVSGTWTFSNQIAANAGVILGGNLTASTAISILQDTSDGADSRRFRFCGGGAYSLNRGAGFGCYGNEHASQAGELEFFTGSASNASMKFNVPNSGGYYDFTLGGASFRRDELMYTFPSMVLSQFIGSREDALISQSGTNLELSTTVQAMTYRDLPEECTFIGIAFFAARKATAAGGDKVTEAFLFTATRGNTTTVTINSTSLGRYDPDTSGVTFSVSSYSGGFSLRGIKVVGTWRATASFVGMIVHAG